MMALGTKARYATRIMVFLARHAEGKPVSRYDIGEAEGISPDYVEQILILLKTKRLVQSHRGRNGGFSLTRDADTITLTEVLEAVDGPIMPAPCIGDPCDRENGCPSCGVWKEAAETVKNFFSKTTIGKMARGEAAASSESPIMYQI
jgi:Rrf2 family protein